MGALQIISDNEALPESVGQTVASIGVFQELFDTRCNLYRFRLSFGTKLSNLLAVTNKNFGIPLQNKQGREKNALSFFQKISNHDCFTKTASELSFGLTYPVMLAPIIIPRFSSH